MNMSDYLDLAVSLHTRSLTLFVGTGFSKYMTDDTAPSWSELIIECAKRIDEDGSLMSNLFTENPEGGYINNYELTICAQILEGEYRNKYKSLKEEVVKIINEKINADTINKEKLAHIQDFFKKYPNINIITTNYDTIFSDFIMPDTSRVIIEGNVIPRVNSSQNIYHIHGCINNKNSLVLTLNDYYKFQNSNNYFSRKFFTLLQETTVAILGYSLGDFNLNTILNEVKNTKKQSFKTTDIYYVSKNKVSEVISKFYYSTYGIKTIRDYYMDDFFDKIDGKYERAKELMISVGELKEVIEEVKTFDDDFIGFVDSLKEILVVASSIGIEKEDKKFRKALIKILNQKKELTRNSGAWKQYVHLADWLIEIASIIVIQGEEFEEEFCELACYSFRTSSKRNFFGYSWEAWRIWKNRWKEMKYENQQMLKDIIERSDWIVEHEIDAICK